MVGRARWGMVTMAVSLGLMFSGSSSRVDAHGGNTNLIHSCVTPGGPLKIVGANDVCPGNQTPLDWSIHGIRGYEVVAHQEFVPAGSTTNVHVECTSGKKVLGGGFDIETPDVVKVFSSEPSDGAGTLIDHGWNVMVHNTDLVNARQTTVSAICAVLE